MRVEPLITSENKIRYIVVNRLGKPIEPVLKFIRFKDNNGLARNTIRSYCYHLKLYFQFLEQRKLDYRYVGIDEMGEFLRWLQNPYQNVKVTSISPVSLCRKARTVNIIISTIMSFYDYLMRHQDYSLQVSERLKRQILRSRRGFKGFLYHISRNKMFNAKILKIKEPKKCPKTISKNEVQELVGQCSNLRDRFLIQLLWESAIRIGEALALYLEDFEIDARKVYIRDRGELANMAEIKTVCSPRKLDVSEELINLYLAYLAEIHTDEVDTNHVFIKLSGPNIHEPLEYIDVDSLFKRLRKKSGIYVTPHVLRHSSLTELCRDGWRPEHIRKRAGHAHVQTTMQMYVHPSDEDLRKDWEKAEGHMKLRCQKEEEEV